MKPHSLAVRLSILLLLVVLACGSSVAAQTAASNAALPTAPAPAEEKPGTPANTKLETNSTPASAPQQKPEPPLQQRPQGPPTELSSLPPRSGEPGQTTFEIRYDVQRVSVQGNTDRSFLFACTRDQILPFIGLATPARPRICDSVNNVAEVSFLNNVPAFGRYRFETSIVSRYTDNPRVDPERESLQRGYLRVVGPDMETTLGDSLVNYSRLSFSQNIKGLHAWKQFGENVRVTGTFGYFTDRWGSLYRHFTDFRDITLDCQIASTRGTPGATPPVGPPFVAVAGCIEAPPGSQQFSPSPGNPFKPYSRMVGGFRIERRAGKNGFVALNYSRGKDLLNTLPDALITCADLATSVHRIADIGTGCSATEAEVLGHRFSSPEATNNHVITFDTAFDIKPWRMRVVGEVAYGLTAGGQPPATAVATPTSFVCPSQSPVFGGAVLDSRCFDKFVADPAYRAEVTQRIGKLNWRVDYSRFQPNFSSANARQIRDLQDFNTRGDYQFFKQLGLTISWRRSNDNLNGKRNYTSIVRAPEARLTFRELPFYHRAVIEVGYRERNLDTAGTPLDTCVTLPTVPPTPSVTTKRPSNPGCLVTEQRQATENRLRSTRIPFFGLTLPVGSTSITFDYEHRHDIDAIVRQNSTDTDRFAFGFRGNYTWNGWDVFPSFRYELERLAKLTPNNPALAPTDPTLIFATDFFDAHDTSRSFNAQLQIEAPRYFRFEGTYREFNSISLSALKASAAFDPAQNFFYFNQGFRRPYWHAALSYKFRNDENKLFTVYYDRGNNFFNTGDPFVTDLKSFRETIIGGTILFRFRR